MILLEISMTTSVRAAQQVGHSVMSVCWGARLLLGENLTPVWGIPIIGLVSDLILNMWSILFWVKPWNRYPGFAIFGFWPFLLDLLVLFAAQLGRYLRGVSFGVGPLPPVWFVTFVVRLSGYGLSWGVSWPSLLVLKLVKRRKKKKKKLEDYSTFFVKGKNKTQI